MFLSLPKLAFPNFTNQVFSLYGLRLASEHHGESEAYTVLRNVGAVVIVHATYILNLEEAEDATYAE